MPRIARGFALAAFTALVTTPAVALDGQREDVTTFIRDMADRHGFEAVALAGVFSAVESRPSIIAAISRPAEKTMPWHEYRARFLTERRIARGVDTARLQSAPLRKAADTGVPAQVLLAIVGVETFFGEITGKHRVIDALATLAFDYPPRSPFFRGELEQFLLMTREESLDPLATLGSYAGAMGIPQFMPSSFRAYAIDGDDDGRRDLWRNWGDVFSSVANYLKVHGWRSGEPVMVPADVSRANLAGLEFGKLALTETARSLRDRGVAFDANLPPEAPAVLIELAGAAGPEYRVGFTNFYAITRYNRSQLYASAVNDLAEAIGATLRPASAPPAPASATTQPASSSAPPPFTSVGK
jgi:membrane-bound lytic murein transglycosylase B